MRGVSRRVALDGSTMKPIWLLVLGASFWPGLATAADNSIVMALSPREVPVAVSLDVEAAYVLAPLTIECDERDPLKRIARIGGASKRLIEHATSARGVEVQQATVSLSTEERDSFSVSRSYGSLGQSTLHVIAKLGEKEDLYQAASRIGEFILSAPKMDCIGLRPGVAMLGVDKPERYRGQLLKLIAEHIAASKAGLGSARDIEVAGLEKPVQLIQKNSREVTLFLNYTVKIKL